MVDGWRREESAMDFPDESSLIIEGLKRALFFTIMRLASFNSRDTADQWLDRLEADLLKELSLNERDEMPVNLKTAIDKSRARMIKEVIGLAHYDLAHCRRMFMKEVVTIK
jgi:hypothetical protein